MTKETKFVSFFNQKGGVGKSSLEILVATYCHNVLNLKVGILDADFPQHSVSKLREDEVQLIKTHPGYRDAFRELGKAVYPVLASDPANALTELQKFTNPDDAFDLVFVDLPGTLNTKGVLPTISKLDHIFIPLIASKLVVKSSLEFGMLVKENFIDKEGISLKSLHFLWNNVVKSEKSDLYPATESVIKKAGLSLLETNLYQSVKFRKPDFCSTIFSPDANQIKDTHLVELTEEILTVVGIPVPDSSTV